MTRDDLKLQRLFAAARFTQPAPEEEMPPYMASRLLAYWRTGTIKDDSRQMLKLLFRRALACAAVVMLFALVWGHDALDTTPDSDEAYANYELSDLMP